jgi:hypothetical protein
MNQPGSNRIRYLQADGGAECVSELLAALDRATALIPRHDAGTQTDRGLDLHPSLQEAEAVRGALVDVLSRSAEECSTQDLDTCAAIKDIEYALIIYYPPAQLHESHMSCLSFDAVRRLAKAALEARIK